MVVVGLGFERGLLMGMGIIGTMLRLVEDTGEGLLGKEKVVSLNMTWQVI